MIREEFLERTRSLLPALRERAAQTEQLRRLPDETVKDFQEAGLLRALQPVRFGGYELDPMTFYQAIIEVGTVCGSSAWVLGVVGVHNWQLALFPLRAQEDVWGEDTSVQISSSYAPTGRVEAVDGGYRLSGTWSFSSGCDLCEWVFLGGVITRGDRSDMRTFLVPRDDYRIDDNWHVAGLAGTGSKNIAVEDAFVPEHRTHRFIDAFRFESPGNAVHTAPLYRLPFGCVFSNAIAVPAIGVALGALAHYREATRTRVSMLSGAKAAEDPFAQARLAEAASEIEAARSAIERNWAQITDLARRSEPIPVSLRARCRFDGANATARAVRATDRLFEASGGEAIFLDNPIQRAWRDVHAMRAHAINNPDAAARLFGRSELGLFEALSGSDLFL